MTRLRAAVVGVGYWGQVHVEAYWRNPETVLVAVCGQTNRARAEQTASQFDARPYLDIAEMLEREKPDIVSVITPDHLHFEPYLQVLQSGVHCLLEKPLAMDLAEARTLVDAAKNSPGTVGINFNHRYSTPFLQLQRDVAAGRVGDPITLLWRFTGGHYPERQQLPLAHLLYMQSHGFNMIETFGGPVTHICGHASDPRETEQLTSATFSLQFENGAVGSFVASVDGDYKDPAIYTFELMGTGGRAQITDAIGRYEFCPRASITQEHQEQKGEEARAEVWNSHFFDDESRQFSRTTDRHIAALVAAIREGRPAPIPITEGLRALELGEAARLAAMEGQVIEVGWERSSRNRRDWM